MKKRQRGEIISFEKILFRYSLLRGIQCYGMGLKGEKRKAVYLWFRFAPFYLRDGKAAGEQEWRDDLFKLCRFFSLEH